MVIPWQKLFNELKNNNPSTHIEKNTKLTLKYLIKLEYLTHLTQNHASSYKQ